jgi:hypothetical protein
MTYLERWVWRHFSPADVLLIDLYPDFYQREYSAWLLRQMQRA